MPRLLQFSVATIIVLLQAAGIFSSQDLALNHSIPKESSYFFYQRQEYPRDCKEAIDLCTTQNFSGVILIKPDGYHEPFEVYCDNEIDGGGWTVIHRRQDGAVAFQRDWLNYKLGFGFLSQEFYLGNEKVSFLTNQNTYQLRIDFTYSDGSSYYAIYTLFRISDEFSGYTLISVGQFFGTADFTTDHPINCQDVYERGNIDSGVYDIKPTKWGGLPFQVYCNMTDGGGWTVFQRRVNGSVSFDVDWDDYKHGFGSPNHEIWLGNEKIFSLTNQRRCQLRIDFVDRDGDPYFAKYNFFRINNEANNYRLTVASYSKGDAGDSLSTSYNNTDFSTRDRENDDYSGYHCVVDLEFGAWWYGDECYDYFHRHSLLNGDYDKGYICWGTLPRSGCFVKYSEMKIRPV